MLYFCSQLMTDCTALCRRVCLLHSAKPSCVTPDSHNTLSNSLKRKPKPPLTNMPSISLLLYSTGRLLGLFSFLSTYIMNHVFNCFMLYSLNCTQMVSMRPFQLNIWVFLPGELLFIAGILYITRAGVSPLIVLKVILYNLFSFLRNKRCLVRTGKYGNEELTSARNRVKNGC